MCGVEVRIFVVRMREHEQKNFSAAESQPEAIKSETKLFTRSRRSAKEEDNLVGVILTKRQRVRKRCGRLLFVLVRVSQHVRTCGMRGDGLYGTNVYTSSITTNS